jgi:hypothetical protein
VFSDGVAETTISVSPARLRDALQIGAQPAAHTDAPERMAHVKVRELGDPRADVRHHHADPDQASLRERAEGDAAFVRIVGERLPLRFDGVLTHSVRIPGRRAPVPRPRNELGATLLEDQVDLLAAVDLADARQFVARQLPDLDGLLHHSTLPRQPPCSV